MSKPGGIENPRRIIGPCAGLTSDKKVQLELRLSIGFRNLDTVAQHDEHPSPPAKDLKIVAAIKDAGGPYPDPPSSTGFP